jgi:hypothetical protein
MSAIARNGWRNREQLRMYYCCAKSALKMGQVDAPTACDTGYVRAETVEDNVWRTVLSVLTGNNFEQALCEAQANEIQAIAPRLETLVHIKQQIADCETEAANLASALGCIGGAMMQKAIEQRVMDVENRHNDLNRQRLDRARHRRRSAISSRSLVRPTKLHV